MATSKKRISATDEARELGRLAGGPFDADVLSRIRAALQSPQYLLVARAAKIVKDAQLSGFESDLLDAFERFRRLPGKSDPGCAAKLSVIEALDFGNHADAKPFLHAARIVQPEPVWGGSADTAGPLRARAILALANLGYEDIVLLAGEMMGDSEPPVRLAAAEALTHAGARAGAAVLLMATRRENDEPAVLLACYAGLLALAPDWGLPRLQAVLSDGAPAAREVAILALGESRRDDALNLLLELAENTPIARERAQVFQGVALHRSDRALEYLLNIIAEGRAGDAVAAVTALGTQRSDARLVERIRNAVEKRSEAALTKAFSETFADSG